MKPDTCQAMHDIIAQIREAIPLQLSVDDICDNDYKSCSLKLIEYLSSEIDNWEYRLQQNDVPDFRDLRRLASSGQKIHRALTKNGLIKP